MNVVPGIRGVHLAKQPNEINLLQILNAVETKTTLLQLHQNTNLNCIVGRNIQSALDQSIVQAELAYMDILKNTTLQDTIHWIQNLDTQ